MDLPKRTRAEGGWNKAKCVGHEQDATKCGIATDHGDWERGMTRQIPIAFDHAPFCEF